jgi:5-formyltetrahydrofolate cyclo-ligase
VREPDPETLAEAKRRLRRRQRERLRAVGPGEAEAAARRVAAHLAASPELARAGAVILYAALPDELPGRPLHEVVRASGRVPLYPRITAGGGLLFAACGAFEELRPGRYGVPEPPPDRPSRRLTAGDLVLVPGLAFDGRGHRLGRGKGHFDRALAPPRPAACVVGVGYAFQLVDAVPCGPGDRGVDAFLSEAGWLRLTESGACASAR